MNVRPWLLVGLAGVVGSCQSYEFAYQPDQDRDGRHLRFEVETPSKADLLFVVDNSGSMREEQAALLRSFAALIQALGAADTSYRVGIVSTEAQGFRTLDCNAQSLPPEYVGQLPDSIEGSVAGWYGHVGNCDRASGPTQVEIGRPHDGSMGRLLAAYDPGVWGNLDDATVFGALTSAQRSALATLVPTAVDDGPTYVNGQKGVPWVIDRDLVRSDACNACGCNACDKTDACYQSCAERVADAYVRGAFTSNLAGLGVNGSGYEEGIRAALLAVGIDAREVGGQEVTPSNDLTDPAPTAPYPSPRPNTLRAYDSTGSIRVQSWIRPDALLGIMFVSDEEDCSMPEYLWASKDAYEEGQLGDPQPASSICYRRDLAENFFPTGTMAGFLRQKKGSAARVVVGVISALEKQLNGAAGEGADCVSQASATPEINCSCLASVSTDPADGRWCAYTHNDQGNGTGTDFPRCNALAGDRYVEFAMPFRRKVFESVCRNDVDAFGETLTTYARLVNQPCFDLTDRVRPVDDQYISVRRRLTGTSGTTPELIQRTEPNSSVVGWYYDREQNQVCLTGRDRVIGDVYDIFVIIKDQLDGPTN